VYIYILSRQLGFALGTDLRGWNLLFGRRNFYVLINTAITVIRRPLKLIQQYIAQHSVKKIILQHRSHISFPPFLRDRPSFIASIYWFQMYLEMNSFARRPTAATSPTYYCRAKESTHCILHVLFSVQERSINEQIREIHPIFLLMYFYFWSLKEDRHSIKLCKNLQNTGNYKKTLRLVF
jgi:hypothetical protein